MVNKVVVMALVAIIAAPILLGYAFNLSEVSVTDYAQDGDPVNVTPLLKNDTAYASAMADSYQINSNFELSDRVVWPIYSTTNTRTSIPTLYVEYAAGGYPWNNAPFSFYNHLFFQSNNDGAGSITYNKLDSDFNVISSYADIYTWDWDLQRGTVQMTRFDPSHTMILYSSEFSVSDPENYIPQFVPSADYTSTGYIQRNITLGESTFADIAAGYYFKDMFSNVSIYLPEKTSSILMTIDLNFVAADPYVFSINFDNQVLKLTSSGGTWYLTDSNNNVIFDRLYIDPTPTNNVYQIFIGRELIGSTPNYTFKYHTEFRYVGSWPTNIGAANYFMKYEYDWTKTSPVYDDVDRLKISTNTNLSRTPLMRMDQAYFAAFAYDIISDKTYAPSDFKSNPSTTIGNIEKYGYSIEFAGNTYIVDSDGNIMLGTHKVSVDGLKLESIPVYGGYENKINGNVISTTLTPSTIKFNGQWGASVSTVANKATTHTITEWTPGEFAWDGIDSNFLIVGLLVSFAAFIGLAIYSRRSKTSLWPLMIVCGCAAMLFLFML